jgi:hypothetical protein
MLRGWTVVVAAMFATTSDAFSTTSSARNAHRDGSRAVGRGNTVPPWLPAAASLVVSSSLLLGPTPAALASADMATRSASEFSDTAGFEDFAAQGGKMKADPSCFFNQCKDATTSCFSNPACLKGITCLGNCRGEQLCATQCFARFGSEKLNSWLSCTLEEQECVTTGVKQNTDTFYANPPPVVKSFKPSDLQGKWYKVLGYNPKYDNYPCQTNTFEATPGGTLENDILFRVPKPDGSGSWQNKCVPDPHPHPHPSLTARARGRISFSFALRPSTFRDWPRLASAPLAHPEADGPSPASTD